MRLWISLSLVFVAHSAIADVLVPVRTIRAKELLSVSDFVVKSGNVPGAVTHIEQIDGKEARVALYAGRPVRAGDIGPPALIERNQIVSLIFSGGLLRISTEGRALARAAAGEEIRVMNLSSRTTIRGIVRADGAIEVK